MARSRAVWRSRLLIHSCLPFRWAFGCSCFLAMTRQAANIPVRVFGLDTCTHLAPPSQRMSVRSLPRVPQTVSHRLQRRVLHEFCIRTTALCTQCGGQLSLGPVPSASVQALGLGVTNQRYLPRTLCLQGRPAGSVASGSSVDAGGDTFQRICFSLCPGQLGLGPARTSPCWVVSIVCNREPRAIQGSYFIPISQMRKQSQGGHGCCPRSHS